MARRFHWIDKDIIYELLFSKTTLEGLKVEQEDILNLLRTWVLEKDPGIIAISDFERDAIEARCEALADNRGTGFKIQSDKEHDELPYGMIIYLNSTL